MDGRFVIARAFGGKPIKRVLVDTSPAIAYLANPAFLDRVETGESSVVGFPLEDVYQYDPQCFSEMVDLWKRGNKELPWNKLRRLNANSEVQ